MTLLRQLILVIVTLFTLLFAGTFAISVNNTQRYLEDQLATIAQDTATSLGMTLSPHFVVNEMVIQRRTAQDGMMKMQHTMMAHMMEHMQAGKDSMAMCPMMKQMGGMK